MSKDFTCSRQMGERREDNVGLLGRGELLFSGVFFFCLSLRLHASGSVSLK